MNDEDRQSLIDVLEWWAYEEERFYVSAEWKDAGGGYQNRKEAQK